MGTTTTPKAIAPDTGLIMEDECPPSAETSDPRWDRARKLRDDLKLAFMRSIDAQVMLGGELLALKNQLGFSARGGDRKSKGHDVLLIGPRRTWPGIQP